MTQTTTIATETTTALGSAEHFRLKYRCSWSEARSLAEAWARGAAAARRAQAAATQTEAPPTLPPSEPSDSPPRTM